jgi:outer membrane biosynthesis protein TonB
VDPRWDKSLLDAVQAAVHDPVDGTDMSTPGIHATVRFTFLDGVIEYPEIVQSTGDPELDKLVVDQVASAQAPRPAVGLQIDAPHQFVLDLDVPTPYESFEYGVFNALDYAKIYPKDAVMGGSQGSTTVGFDYLDGEASNITTIKSSGSKSLDRASLGTVARSKLPPAPPAYAGKTVHLEAVFCYSLIGPGKCPRRKDVILIYGTRL